MKHSASNSQYDQSCRAYSFQEPKNETLLQSGSSSSSSSANSQYDWWMQLNTFWRPIVYHFSSLLLGIHLLLFGDQLVIPLRSLGSHPMSWFEIILVIFVRKLWKSSYCPVTQDFQVLARNFESMYCSIPATH